MNSAEKLGVSLPEMEQIEVKLGEFFKISPFDINGVVVEYPPGDRRVVKSFLLNIEGFGEGKLMILKDTSIFDEEVSLEPPKTPAGPVEVKTVVDNGEKRIDLDSLPINIVVAIAGTPEQLDRIVYEMDFNGKRFIGVEGIVGEVALYTDASYPEKKDLVPGDAYFIYRDAETGEGCEVVFPPRADIFDKLQFRIKKK